MNNLDFYFDYAATTPVDSFVAAKMQRFMTADGAFANPSSSHGYGQVAARQINQAEQTVCDLLRTKHHQVVFTSGATEANNLAILGVAHAKSLHGAATKHFITSKIEHKSVVDVFVQLEQQGHQVSWLKPNAQGQISAEDVLNNIQKNTVLVSVMWVHNELGVINDIKSIVQVTHAHKILLHVDATQAVGKLPIDLTAIPVDLLSFSAHKIYGPKGVGALLVNTQQNIRLQPMMWGGGQQQGLRPGTIPTQQIIGLAAAAQICRDTMADDYAHIAKLQQAFLEYLQQNLTAIVHNGGQASGLPHIVNMSFTGVHGEALLWKLRDFAVASGSACMSATAEPSYVLRALGLDDALAEATIRFSFGRGTTMAAVQQLAQQLVTVVSELQMINPLWVGDNHAA